eukprot:2656636-Amphidinium_carterae.1
MGRLPPRGSASRSWRPLRCEQCFFLATDGVGPDTRRHGLWAGQRIPSVPPPVPGREARLE